MRTAEGIVTEIISAVKPLKVNSPKTTPEKFVNVGIEATMRLLADNSELIAASVHEYARQVAESVKAEAAKIAFEGADVEYNITFMDIEKFIK